MVFFFKQKTAYEMRISDWSSDVCSSDLMVSARGGETIHAEFAQSYGLVDGVTKVKLAGLVVGVVTGVEHTDKGTAMVAMKVDREALDPVGSTPTARIVALPILGGQYSVELHRGGTGTYAGDTHGLARAERPLVSDTVLAALLSGRARRVGRGGYGA